MLARLPRPTTPRHGLLATKKASPVQLSLQHASSCSDLNLVTGPEAGSMLLRTENDKSTQETSSNATRESRQAFQQFFDVVRRTLQSSFSTSVFFFLLTFFSLSSASLPSSPPPSFQQQASLEVLRARGPRRPRLPPPRRWDLHAEAAAAAAGSDDRASSFFLFFLFLFPRRRDQRPQGEEEQ